MALVKEDVPEEQRVAVHQQDPEHLHIKEEPEELWTGLEGEQLHLEEETVSTRFPFTAFSMKKEDDEENTLFSQLHLQQTEDRDVPTRSSADQMTAEISGGAETSRNPILDHEQKSDSELSDFWPETGDGDSDLFFSCPECGKQFLHKWSLQIHFKVMSHSAVGSSDCLVNKKCDGGKQHVDSCRKVQTELKSFSCDDCGKRFSSKSNLHSHISVHTGQKRFACELCGQRFSHKTSLNRHLRVHTGQKPFACAHCGQRFSRKTTLTTHRRVHTGQKPFACGHCGQRFSQKAHLNSHMRVHTGHKPFACAHCEKRFSRKSLLNGHIRVHTGQKPFACELCGKRFCQKTSLNRHVTVHTGKKPFACELCGQRFSQKTNLNRHMRVYTGHKEQI